MNKGKLCEVCNEHEYTHMCDFGVGSGIISSSYNFKKLTSTCDKKLCKKCAINLWVDSDVCPEHARIIKAKLVNVF